MTRTRTRTPARTPARTHSRGTAALLCAATAACAGMLTACGDQDADEGGKPGSSAVREAGLEGVRWVPRSVTVDGEKLTAPDGPDGHVTFKAGPAEKGAGGGSGGKPAGCNSVGADARIEGDTVRVGDVVATKMACGGPDAQRFESSFIEAFSGTHTVRLSDGGRTATLSSAPDTQIVLTTADKPASP